MSITQAESQHRILASDVVPVHVASLLRHVQNICDPGRDIAITLEVDDSLYASADPDLLVYALGILLSVTCLAQPDAANIALSCSADDGGIRIEAEGEPPEGGTARPIARELSSAEQAIRAMNGALELEHAACLFRLTLAPARPSRISSRPPGTR